MIRTFGAALVVATACGTMAAVPVVADAHTTAKAREFANCTAMHRVYPHGVGKVHARDKVRGSTKPVTNFHRSNALYAANKKSDRDHDGVACEKH